MFLTNLTITFIIRQYQLIIFVMKKSKYIWFNDKFVQWDKATTHVLSHGLHYGSGIFEGIRAYSNKKDAFIFRLSDHYTRFFNSAKVAFIKIPYSQKKLSLIHI